MAQLDGAIWRKSTYSGANGCVEVAFVDGHIAVRDSKHQRGPILVFTPVEWKAFLSGAHDGEFELPALSHSPPSVILT
jgi:hypothetical protein